MFLQLIKDYKEKIDRIDELVIMRNITSNNKILFYYKNGDVLLLDNYNKKENFKIKEGFSKLTSSTDCFIFYNDHQLIIYDINFKSIREMNFNEEIKKVSIDNDYIGILVNDKIEMYSRTNFSLVNTIIPSNSPKTIELGNGGTIFSIGWYVNVFNIISPIKDKYSVEARDILNNESSMFLNGFAYIVSKDSVTRCNYGNSSLNKYTYVDSDICSFGIYKNSSIVVTKHNKTLNVIIDINEKYSIDNLDLTNFIAVNNTYIYFIDSQNFLRRISIDGYTDYSIINYTDKEDVVNKEYMGNLDNSLLSQYKVVATPEEIKEIETIKENKKLNFKKYAIIG